MWKRGKRSRSNSCTRKPCWASSVDTVEPAGPPPMTTTSGDPSRGVWGDDMGALSFGRWGLTPVTLRRLVRAPGGAEQVDQGPQLGRLEVAELALVAGADLGVQRPDEFETRGAD